MFDWTRKQYLSISISISISISHIVSVKIHGSNGPHCPHGRMVEGCWVVPNSTQVHVSLSRFPKNLSSSKGECEREMRWEKGGGCL